MFLTIKNIFNEELSFCLQALRSPAFYIFSALCFLLIGYIQPDKLLVSILLFLPLCLLSVIDLKHMVLPDIITVPLLIIGLVLAVFLNDISWQNSLVGIIAGGAFFGIIYWGSHKILGRHGMGLGDVKLLAALGAWVGLSGVPLVVLVASISAIPIFMAYNFIYKTSKQPLPFGPFLAIGGLFVWLCQPQLWQFIMEWRRILSHTLIGD